MIYIQLDDLIRLQELSISKTGGEYGIRDSGMLESAYYAPLASFGGTEAFPEPLEKIARLTWGLISNHAFIDGNKRIGAASMLVLLKLNHFQIKFSQEELSNLTYRVAQGMDSYSDVLNWIKLHLTN